MTLTCVIHYEHLLSSKEVVNALNESKFKVLIENKVAREWLRGENAHLPQCSSIPSELVKTTHGVHRKCYQKFTMGVSIEKKKRQKDEAIAEPSRKRPRRSGEGAKQLFPVMCMFCKSAERKKLKGNRQKIHKITLPNVEELIKKAAVDKNDLVMQNLVIGENLREREFQVHDKCYRDYTNVSSYDESDSGTIKSGCKGVEGIVHPFTLISTLNTLHMYPLYTITTEILFISAQA